MGAGEGIFGFCKKKKNCGDKGIFVFSGADGHVMM